MPKRTFTAHKIHAAEVIFSNERFQTVRIDNGMTVTLTEESRVAGAEVGDKIKVIYYFTAGSRGSYHGVRR